MKGPNGKQPILYPKSLSRISNVNYKIETKMIQYLVLYKSIIQMTTIDAMTTPKLLSIKPMCEETITHNMIPSVMPIESTYPKFSDKERTHYSRAVMAEACKFSTPEMEFDWAKTQTRPCSKCALDQDLNCFMFNTSGRDAFDRNGYRLRRPECRDCSKTASKGKSDAVKLAKTMGITHKAPEGTECELCKSTKGIVFDHDHEKNVFRGWLCDPCNRSMGVLGDDATSLLKTVAYLSKDNQAAQALILQLKELLEK